MPCFLTQTLFLVHRNLSSIGIASEKNSIKYFYTSDLVHSMRTLEINMELHTINRTEQRINEYGERAVSQTVVKYNIFEWI